MKYYDSRVVLITASTIRFLMSIFDWILCYSITTIQDFFLLQHSSIIYLFSFLSLILTGYSLMIWFTVKIALFSSKHLPDVFYERQYSQTIISMVLN